jgi:hypothetical protein
MSRIARRTGAGTKITFVDLSRRHIHICNLLIVTGLRFTWIRSASKFLRHNIVSEVDSIQGVEHYLENIPSGGDWKEFCATTPVSFRGMHFIGAEFCFQKVRCSVASIAARFVDSFQNHGTYGHWVFDDESCK